MKPHCWWCCHPFEWDSLHYPYSFVSNVFYTTGHFCSWGCMKAYAIDRGKFDTCEYITLMRKRMEGKITSTKPAPKRQALTIFGGSLSIDDFRNDKITVNVKIPGDCVFMEQTVDVKDNVSSLIKLKREKPLERSKSKLETSLGIIRKKKCTDVVGQDSKTLTK